MRNIKKQAEAGRKLLNSTRGLSMGELDGLLDMASAGAEGLIDAVITAFYMGAATGIRQGEQAKQEG